MNRESELINYLKQPVLANVSARGLLLPASIRWVHKSYGGKNKGRWSVFRASELPPHKGFSDALVATLAAKNLLIPFSKDSTRAFFLRESVVDYISDDQEYIYDSIKIIDKYKRL